MFWFQDKDQRSMDIATAKAMLELLLGKHWILYSEFAQFLHTSKYKVINKDQWCNILEFSRTISLDLNNYDIDGACKSSIIDHDQRKNCLANFIHVLILFILVRLQGPFCWTNSSNGCDKSAVRVLSWAESDSEYIGNTPIKTLIPLKEMKKKKIQIKKEKNMKQQLNYSRLA